MFWVSLPQSTCTGSFFKQLSLPVKNLYASSGRGSFFSMAGVGFRLFFFLFFSSIDNSRAAAVKVGKLITRNPRHVCVDVTIVFMSFSLDFIGGATVATSIG